VERTQKHEIVADLHQIFDQATSVVITRQSGLTVAEATELRSRMGRAGATYRVTKNRLARLALDGTAYTGLADMFSGPAAIAYSADPVAAAKVAVEYADTNAKLTVVGGALGEKVLDAAAVKALARLPSLDELRARIVGMIQTPATRVAGALQAPAAQLARVLGARATMGEAE
jgi:large subunit ribosomal protein L10